MSNDWWEAGDWWPWHKVANIQAVLDQNTVVKTKLSLMSIDGIIVQSEPLRREAAELTSEVEELGKALERMLQTYTSVVNQGRKVQGQWESDTGEAAQKLYVWAEESTCCSNEGNETED